MNLKHQFKQMTKRWFAGRAPSGVRVSLNQRSTYIWPTGVGFLLAGVLLLMMIGATNYQNNLAFLLTFLLVGLGLATMVFTYKNIQGIAISIGNIQQAFVGRTVKLPIQLESLTNTQHSAIGVGFTFKSLQYANVIPNGDSQVNLSWRPTERGYIQIPRMIVSSTFPFGWLKTWGYVQLCPKGLVYPQPIEPPLLPSGASGKEAETGVKSKGSEDMFGLRPYQSGEPLARVDWKSYARERGMFIREFVSFQNESLEFSWDDFPGVEAETRLSYLTFLVLEASYLNSGYGLNLPDQVIPFDEGERHRDRCLNALALYGKEAR